jgi:hypothetical protein
VAYYLSLFNMETWHEFKAAGGKVGGFRQSRWGHVKKLKPGDRLLGYLVGAKRWVAVLRVTSEPYIATEPKIWAGDDFAARVDVEIESELTPETGVPITEVLPELTLLDKIKDKKGGSWGAFFIGSPHPGPRPTARSSSRPSRPQRKTQCTVTSRRKRSRRRNRRRWTLGPR